MISVSEVSASPPLFDGLRLPSSRFRPSPKPIATEGTPIARMREHTIAARAENRNFFMHPCDTSPATELRACKGSCHLLEELRGIGDCATVDVL